MLKRTALTNKILLLGCDGMDPRLTKKYVDMGLMPNVKKYIERGAAREDLMMLGGHPTVTPPMWTTLACGCYANVHGITGYYRMGNDIDQIDYNFDSRDCKAEPLWNAFAEAGKKTLVWHWPGSSWPPTSDNPNLLVVDGTSPGSVGMATSQVEGEFLVGASELIKELVYIPKAPMEASAACVVNDLNLEKRETARMLSIVGKVKDDDTKRKMITGWDKHTTSTTEALVDMIQSPIKEATGWANAPAGAKEFAILFSAGLIRRPALILKNEEGIYDKVAIYKSKKSETPLAVCPIGKMVVEVKDEAIRGDKTYKVNRNMKLLKLDPEGKTLTMYISGAMDMENDSCYHPKSLFKEITENAGYPTPTSILGRQDPMLITDCMLDNWYATADWQARAMHYVIEHENIDVVFSHYHAIDLEEHQFIKHMSEHEFNRNPVEVAQKWMQDLYVQTDYYLGKFLHYLDEGWTVIIMSDHAQVSPKHDLSLLMPLTGVATTVFEQMGFTKSYVDENGKTRIDWTQTKAVCQREGHVYINLKGKYDHGIVDPADQYELEEEIITKLYQLTDEKTGHRIVSVALRNRDAVLLGQGGPEAGDIIFWMAEGYNYDHADCLSTTQGESDTSISPIFIAAGQGIKSGFTTDRIIRQIDFAPTVAVLGGVRMPANCEGAPVYQILTEEF